MQQAIDVGNYEEQCKRTIACRLEEDDRMFELFRQERARMIAVGSSIAGIAKVSGGGMSSLRGSNAI